MINIKNVKIQNLKPGDLVRLCERDRQLNIDKKNFNWGGINIIVDSYPDDDNLLLPFSHIVVGLRDDGQIFIENSYRDAVMCFEIFERID